eukprot:TRINITY_DN1797_c2_g4_i1.p1 TRINITY_DN1797_c2_g4~~TRINITY_DN1797_c2_g4_i1.p1  ORF type:complete len:142 (-),score=36.98 TRINITY_DN1797_c2_g4_i1:295-720(-)
MKMGSFVNRRWVTVLTWMIGIFVCVANIYYMCSSTLEWLKELSLPLKVVLGIFVGLFVLIYVTCLLLLAIRKDKKNTFLPPDDEGTADDIHLEPVMHGPEGRREKLEGGGHHEDDDVVGRRLREDIVQMQLPGDIHAGHAI